ncbi:transposase, IS30 family [Idiomarina sp. A28L]|uniref:IS30 family transposase n=1 Tax=Idiomarina sp. A28L TaxID=1036674 RepID=UPI0002138791|nr:IS30 family transposase [Idiomarina sp. A28L]EGN75172.1 transposase, IS30 family [Idiomarina sp. A28L]
MSYRQLTEGQRYQISLLLSEKFSLRKIAEKLDVAPSTISRELRRNSITSGSYEPSRAHLKTLKRRSSSAKKRICDKTKIAVEFMLELDWSPEQISAICKRIGRPVSHEWVYTHILADFKQGGQLHAHLRHRLKRYKKRLHKQRGRILERRSIHERPRIVEHRERFGDWEIDTVIGKRGTGVIVTALERKSRFYLTRKLASKHAGDVADTLIKMLQPFQSLVHTITADNGLEFAEHKRVAAGLNADVYFADPYASYQRGANENANGLLRQYVPKGSNLRSLTNEQLSKYQQRLNLRPRKVLGFKQPDVIFKEQLQYAQSECCSY